MRRIHAVPFLAGCLALCVGCALEEKDPRLVPLGIQQIIDGKKPLDSVCMEVSFPRVDQPSPIQRELQADQRTVVLHGNGVGIWNGERQFQIDKDKVLEILKDLPAELVTEKNDDGAIHTRAQGYYPGMIRVVLGDVSRTFVYEEPANAWVVKFLRLGHDRAQKEGRTAASLEDGLKKIARKELALETLMVYTTQKMPERFDVGHGPVHAGVRIQGFGADVHYGNHFQPVPREKLEQLVKMLVDNEAGSLSEVLKGPKQIGFVVRVLNQERFIRVEPGAEAKQDQDQLDRYGRIQKGLDQLCEGFFDKLPTPKFAPGDQPPSRPTPPPAPGDNQ